MYECIHVMLLIVTACTYSSLHNVYIQLKTGTRAKPAKSNYYKIRKAQSHVTHK